VRTPERGTSVGVRGFIGETTREFRRMNGVSSFSFVELQKMFSGILHNDFYNGEIII
jgi:enoyl-[acyl-carrier-protein] reductase (NADH)